MQKKFQSKYRIPSARYPYHNYDGGVYFITICTAGMEHFFGKIAHGEMNVTEVGEFVTEQIQNVSQHYPYADIPLYVVMPNHVHVIVFIDGSPGRDVARNVCTNARYVSTTNRRMSEISPKKGSLAAVIRGIKSSVTRYANQYSIPFAWQSRYHDRIIRSQPEMNRIAEYIENNVANWELDRYNDTFPSVET